MRDQNLSILRFDPAELKTVFCYSTDSPSCIVKILKNGSRRNAGSLTSQGYYVTIYKGVRIQCHQLCLILHDILPDKYETQVDHIDRNPSNNRLENLRWVTPSENGLNKTLCNQNKRFASVDSRFAKFNRISGKYISRWFDPGAQQYVIVGEFYDMAEAAFMAKLDRAKQLSRCE